LTKYRVTVRAELAEGRRQRTFTTSSDLPVEELTKQIQSDYDMLKKVHVTVREA